MSGVYDNWERLVAATLDREELRRLAVCPSFISDYSCSSFNSDYSPDFSSRFRFDYRCQGGLTELSLEELRAKTDNFGANGLIGKGSRGSVYFACLNNGKEVAVRKLPHGPAVAEFLTHVSIMSRLKHENLVEYLGYCKDNSLCVFAYEFAPMGSLQDILHVRQGIRGAHPSPVLDWMQRVRISVDAARGLEYLHEKTQPSVIHYNIKSSNVLLFEDYKAKIADFHPSNRPPHIYKFDGLYYAKRLPLTHHAPEYAIRGKFTKESDVYLFGVVLLELLTGRNAFDLVGWAEPRLGEDRVKECIDPKLEGQHPPKAAAKFAAVAALCVQYDPESRPNMTVIVKALQPLLKFAPSP